MTVAPIPAPTTVLPWQGRRVVNRQRRTALNRERDAMAGQIEAEIVVRQGSALTATQRSILQSYIGVATMLSHQTGALASSRRPIAGISKPWQSARRSRKRR
jgi:hypothetical protein